MPLEIPVEATIAHEKTLLANHKDGNWDNIRILADFSNIDVLMIINIFLFSYTERQD